MSGSRKEALVLRTSTANTSPKYPSAISRWIGLSTRSVRAPIDHGTQVPLVPPPSEVPPEPLRDPEEEDDDEVER